MFVNDLKGRLRRYLLVTLNLSSIVRDPKHKVNHHKRLLILMAIVPIIT